jgi:parallel beta-helix repeat protein
MVYKKYVRINGKLHGPYYYESYREGGKVKKRYLGTNPPEGHKDFKNTKTVDDKSFVPRKSLRFVWVLALLFLLIMVALFLRPTGNVVLQISLAVLMEADDLVQKDVEVILSLSKEGVVLSEVSMTLEEYINGQVEPVEVTQITESCQDITEESVEGVCYNETVSSEMEEVCTEEEVCVDKITTETKEVCTEEEVCVDKITTETKEVCTEEGEETVCHDEDVEIVEEECESEETCSEEMVEVVEEECEVQEECTNETVSKTKEICENQVVQNVVGQDCVKETTTDYYYNVSGEYLRDIEELMDYTFNETGRYVLTFSVPSLGVSEEKILDLGGLFEVQEFVVSFSGGGDGSAGDPFQITNCTQLQEMEDNLTAYYIITQDVDCSDTPNWNSGVGFVPVGNGSDKFLGNFDGQNNTVTGLYINSSSQYVGLFGFIGLGPNISDVGLVNISIISNYTQGSVGGFTGRFSGNNKISNSYITGNLTSESESGGFVGAMDGSGALEINNSYFEGSVYSTYYYIGGLVGYASSSGPVNISNSYSAGLVNTTINDLGGLVGVFYGNIVNTFTSTNVTGDGAYDGSVVGEYNGVFTNTYWNNHSYNPDNCTAASGNPSGCNIVQDNDAYFHSSSNAPMSSWDFTNVWQEESGDYPTLRSFGEAAPSPPPCDVNISECKTSGWSDNTYYCLNQSVNTTVHCMTIDAKNVTLDCQGYNLTGDRTASPSNDYGINASGFNSTTIKNCVVSNFHYGTYFTYVNHVSFENNTANNNLYYGFYFQYSDYNNLTDNVAENHTNNGIDLRTSDNNVLTNNTMSNNNVGSSSTGLYMVSSYNNTLTGNEMYNNKHQ